MGLDDLLGLLFLFFFIILPAIQGFMRRGKQMPDDFEPDDIPLPGEGKANQPPQPTQASQPQPTPPSRAPAPTPPPRPVPSQPTLPSRTAPPVPRPTQPQVRTLEQIERERLSRQVQTPPQPRRVAPPQEPQTRPFDMPVARKGEHWEFSNSPHDIVNGIVWHQILAEPRGAYWRRIKRSKH